MLHVYTTNYILINTRLIEIKTCLSYKLSHQTANLPSHLKASLRLVPEREVIGRAV
jgi:hypothetical protein